tara:strand:- start:2799 stop:3314 length:516 start_codon:yes stop_codon:yes gene_type:complete
MRITFILLLSFISFMLLPFSSVYAAPLTVGGTATDWELQAKDGSSVQYYVDSEDKVSVIIFWATWCPYCITLMPHLEDIYRQYRNKDVKFYAIDVYEDGVIDPIEYFDKKGFTYTMLMDGDEVATQYGVRGTPAVYVVGKDKKVVYKRPTGMSDVLVKQNVGLRIKQALAK